jgi:hypothetical protein
MRRDLADLRVGLADFERHLHRAWRDMERAFDRALDTIEENRRRYPLPTDSPNWRR